MPKPPTTPTSIPALKQDGINPVQSIPRTKSPARSRLTPYQKLGAWEGDRPSIYDAGYWILANDPDTTHNNLLDGLTIMREKYPGTSRRAQAWSDCKDSLNLTLQPVTGIKMLAYILHTSMPDDPYIRMPDNLKSYTPTDSAWSRDLGCLICSETKQGPRYMLNIQTAKPAPYLYPSGKERTGTSLLDIFLMTDKWEVWAMDQKAWYRIRPHLREREQDWPGVHLINSKGAGYYLVKELWAGDWRDQK